MNWKSIRLELSPTREFPQGSPARAYLVRLPLGEDGLIDADGVSGEPSLATVRRFWPNEPDMRGYVIRTSAGWAFSYSPGDEDDETVFHLEAHRILAGEQVTLSEPDGSRLPFRIASVQDLNWSRPPAAQAG